MASNSGGTPGSGGGRQERDHSTVERPDEDAVEQARRWLAERGVTVLDDAVPGSPPPVHGGTGAATPRRDPVLGEAVGSGNDPESVARTIVLGKLSAQARTRDELERALKARDVPQEAATSVLDRMEGLGLIDDSRFARDWIESRQQRRYLSKAALRRELTAKGIDRTEIESALAVVESDDELDAARALAAKKVRSMGELAPEVRCRRLAGMLVRRGFSSGVVSRILGETLDSLQE